MPTWWPWLRDVILFFSGLLGSVYETVVATTDRPELLILFAGMMGMPYFLRADDRRR